MLAVSSELSRAQSRVRTVQSTRWDIFQLVQVRVQVPFQTRRLLTIYPAKWAQVHFESSECGRAGKVNKSHFDFKIDLLAKKVQLLNCSFHVLWKTLQDFNEPAWHWQVEPTHRIFASLIGFLVHAPYLANLGANTV